MDDKLIKDNLIAKWLDDRLNDDEKKLLESSRELDELKVVIDEIDTWKVPTFDVEAGLKNLNKRKKQQITHTPTRKVVNIKRWLSIAASILILVSGGYFYWDYLSNQNTNIKTLLAETKTIELPSGSVIKLDALSEIKYSKKDWKNNRVVYLSGQAHFNVTKGDFTVKTDKGEVSVLGTQFNVNTKGNHFDVVCYEGKVKVTYLDDKAILTAGKSVDLDNKTLIPSTHQLKTPNWFKGYSKYNNVALQEVVADIEERYQIQIELPIKHQKLGFTGTLTHHNLNTALQTLFTAMELEYSLENKNKVMVK